MKKTGFRFERPREDLEAKLRSQMANMRRSCEAFDEGAHEEAERLASSVFIICHDGGKQQSLLTMLQMKRDARFYDTALKAIPAEPDVVQLGPPLLAVMNDAAGMRYVAPLGPAPSAQDEPWLVKFSKWWDQTVYANSRGHKLSRKNLVFAMRSQDGGGHVDSALTNEAYYRFLAHGDHQSWNAEGTLSINTQSPGIAADNLHWLSMRQIAWEVANALQRLGFDERLPPPEQPEYLAAPEQ